MATGLEKVSFHSSPKERQCQRMRKLLHNCTHLSSVQFSSVAQMCPTLCEPMNRSMPGLPVHHQLPEFIQTYVHRVSDAIQPSSPLSSPSPPAPILLHNSLISAFSYIGIFVSFQEVVPKSSKFIYGLHIVLAKKRRLHHLNSFMQVLDLRCVICPYLT